MVGKDYRIELRVRNAPFLRAIEAAGYKNVPDFCRANNFNLGPIFQIASLKLSATTKNGLWRKPVMDAARVLKILPEDLFPAQHIDKALTKNKADFEIGIEDLEQLTSALTVADDHLLPDETMAKEETSRILHETMNNILSPREEYVLKRHYGIDCSSLSIKELSEEMGVCIQRVSQIEKKAIGKIQRSIEHNFDNVHKLVNDRKLSKLV